MRPTTGVQDEMQLRMEFCSHAASSWAAILLWGKKRTGPTPSRQITKEQQRLGGPPCSLQINRCWKEVGNSPRLAVFLMCRDFCNNGTGCNEIGPLLPIFVPLMSLEAPGCAKGEGRGLATSSLLNKM